MTSIGELRKKPQTCVKPWATHALDTKNSSLSSGLETLHHLLGDNNQNGSFELVLYSFQSIFINCVISFNPYYHSVKK